MTENVTSSAKLFILIQNTLINIPVSFIFKTNADLGLRKFKVKLYIEVVIITVVTFIRTRILLRFLLSRKLIMRIPEMMLKM